MLPSFEILIAEGDETYKLSCGVETTTLDLKDRIHHLRGIPLERVTLTYRGQELVDYEKLAHYGIVDGVVIDCMTTITQGRKQTTSLPRHRQLLQSDTILGSDPENDDIRSPTRSEVANVMSFWQHRAAEGNFDPDVHIVDPTMYDAHLYYLQDRAARDSEFFACGGHYDIKSDALRHRDKPPNNALQLVWEGFQRRPLPMRMLPWESAHLRKSYEILCWILSSLDHLREVRFSASGYSILTRPSAAKVAKLNPIFRGDLEVLKREIERSVAPNYERVDDSRVDTDNSATRTRLQKPWYAGIRERSNTIMKRIDLSLENLRSEESSLTSLSALRLTLLVLDLALVSYVGSHALRFDQEFLRRSACPIEIGGKSEGTRSIVCSLRSLACLDEYLDRNPVWVFSFADIVTPSTSAPNTTSEEGFAVLANIKTFADVWGPVWSVQAHDGKSSHISQHLLSKGVIRAQHGEPSQQIAGITAIPCHWYRYRGPVQQNQDVEICMDMDAWLLIRGNLRDNDQCRYTLGHYEDDFMHDMGFLGTVSNTWELDTRTFGVTAGQWLNIIVSGTQKRIPAILLKDHILNKLKYNPKNANIEWLNNFVGAEVSHCTGNARRVRMRDIIRLPTVQSRLLRFDPLWKTTDWGRQFDQALEDKDVCVLTDLWDHHVEMRENIGHLICQILELLHNTGTHGEHLIVAYFSKNVDRQINLDVRGNDWARLLEDSVRSATYAVVRDTCMAYQGNAGRTVAQCTCGQEAPELRNTVFQTKILFFDGLPCLTDTVSVEPHRGKYRVLSVEGTRAKRIMLEPANAKIPSRSVVYGLEVISGDPARPRAKDEMRAIIKASTVTYSGMKRERQVPQVPPTEAHHHTAGRPQRDSAAKQHRKRRRQSDSNRNQTQRQCCCIL